MMAAKRGTYVIRDGKAVLKHLAPPLDHQKRGPASALPRPHVISDGLPDIMHPSNGKVYSSKKAFRDETRARGLVEVGNEDFTPREEYEAPGSIAEDIARSYDQLERGEVTKEQLDRGDVPLDTN